jgi:hypothetical protein
VENADPIWQTCRLMTKSPDDQPQHETTPAPAAVEPAATRPACQPPRPTLPREIGGREGPEPTRFGDWEKAGRCIDF